MNMVQRLLFSIVLLLLVTGCLVSAAPDLQVTLKQYLVTTEQTTGEKLIHLGRSKSRREIASGDLIEYLLIAENTSQQIVRSVELIGQIPSKTHINKSWLRKVKRFLKGNQDRAPVFLELKKGGTQHIVYMDKGGKVPLFQLSNDPHFLRLSACLKKQQYANLSSLTAAVASVKWRIQEMLPHQQVRARYRVRVE